MTIINNSFNFLFIHVPKAAGTTITSVLSKYTNYCDLEIGGTAFGEAIQPAYMRRYGLKKHSTATEVKNLVGSVAWSRYFTFSFVRNPFLRCLSTYHFLRKWESPNAEFNLQMRSFKSFEEFVMSNFWMKGNGPDEIFLPQTHWLCNGKKNQNLLLDYVGRVENIEQDISCIFSRIGLLKESNSINKLPILNSSNKLTCKDFESKDVIERIQEKYEVDFDLFGYSTSVDEITII